MKKQIWKATALFAGLGLLASCSSEETQVTPENQTAEVSFSVNIGDVTRSSDDGMDTTPDEDNCMDPETFKEYLKNNPGSYYAEIKLDYETSSYQKKLRVVDNQIVSDPISMLVEDGHSVEYFYIKEEGSDEIFWSSVADDTGAKYYNFIPVGHHTPMPITWGGTGFLELTKKVCPITLLCAVNDYADNFGYGQWGTDLVKAQCFNYSVNVCGGCEDNVPEGHRIGTSTVHIKKNGTDLWISNEQAPGSIGEMCFSDNLSLADADELFEIKIEIVGFPNIIAKNVPGSYIFEGKYKENGFWEIPAGAENGYMHFDLCDQDWTKDAVVKPLNPDAENIWPFIVETTMDCEPDCPSQCGNAIFANFGKELDGSCAWNISRCVDAYADGGYVFSSLPQELCSPEYSFEHGKEYKLTFSTYAKQSDAHSLIQLNSPFNLDEITFAPTTDSHKYVWRTFTVKFHLKENKDNCEYLKVKFKGHMRIGIPHVTWIVDSSWKCIYDTWFQSIEVIE